VDKEKIFLLPGELVVKKKPTEIATLLGSCVAVCLFDTQQRFGGMNHFMLPKAPADAHNMAKYGDYATERLISLMELAGANLKDVEAKIYGGGAVVGHLGAVGNIGEKNIAVAREVISRAGISIVAEDVAGVSGRKIVFRNWCGEVELHYTQKSGFNRHREEKVKELSRRKIKVLVVDDSPTVRSLLKKGIEQDPDIEVVATAGDAYEARARLLEYDPDVITLDIVMPKMDGITFLKKIMVYRPKPVIIVSTIAPRGSRQQIRADKIGAAAVVDKNELHLYQGLENIRAILCPKIKQVATLTVNRKRPEEVKDL